MTQAVVIYSGGMDSLTLLHQVYHSYSAGEILAVSVDYGQRHRKELDFAKQNCQVLKIEQVVFDLQELAGLLGGSSLTDRGVAVPEGHYTEPSMKQTVVPNRNMVLLSLAASVALSREAMHLYYGAHSGDHAIYPDCRMEFVRAFEQAVREGNWGAGKFSVHAPFLGVDKGFIVARGLEMGVDYSQSWTCYQGREKACGRCGSCVERLEAFASVGIQDPVEYE